MLKPSLLVTLLCCSSVIVHSAPLKKDLSPNQCVPDSRHMRVSARHIEAGGVGYNKGYTTLETFLASDPNQWAVMPFLDARWHIFNDGKMDVNAGLGARAQWGSRVYGLNVYYDYRNTHHRGYNQVGGGLETLGTLWDVRVNGYLPVGGKMSKPYDIEFGGFEGHSILVNRKFEYAMKGIDGELGFHFGKTANFDFYAAAGPYYFKGEIGDGAIGGKARIAGYYKQYVTLELSDSFDSVFHNNVQGQLTLSFPFGPKSRPMRSNPKCPDSCENYLKIVDRMVQPVGRQEIVVVDTHRKNDPASNVVYFVDNRSSSAGTYESPYPTMVEALAAAGEGDIIYVFPGDGTTTGLNAGSSSFVLKNYQQLLGAGSSQTVATNLGTVVIPPQAVLRPYFTAGANTNVIQVANGNVISGLHILLPGGTPTNWAIGSTSDISGLTINDNFMQTSYDQSYLVMLSGSGSVTGNVTISNNIISSSATSTYGIYAIHESNQPLNLSLVNNQMTGFSSDSLFLTSTLGSVTANIQNNQFLRASTDYAFEFDVRGTSQLVANVTGNIIQSENGCALFISDGGQITANLSGNQIYALRTVIDTELLDNSSLLLSASNNQFYSDGVSQYMVYLYPNDTSTMEVSFENNIMSISAFDDPSYGIYVNSFNSANVNLTCIENSITAAGHFSPYALFFQLENESVMTALVESSILRALDGEENATGIYATTLDNSLCNLTVKNCDILAPAFGILLELLSNSRISATVNNNTIGLTTKGETALEVRTNSTSSFNLVCNSNTMNGNSVIQFPCSGTGGFTATCENNRFNGESNGAVFSATNSSTGTMNLSLVSNDIFGPAGTNEYVTFVASTGGGLANFNFEDNSVTSGGIGILGNSTNNGSSLVARVLSNLSQTAQGDQFIAETGSPTACVNYQNNVGNASNTFTNSGGGTFTLYYEGNNQPAINTSITTGDVNSCPIP